MIEVEQVTKSYKAGAERFVAVDALSFCAEPGKVFAILGPNGSGKTTLLRVLAGLLKADSGKVLVNGIDVATDPQSVRRKLGFLTGSAALHQKLTVRQTLHLFRDLHGLTKSEFLSRESYLMATLELEPFYDKIAGGLSMGQKQRAMIARTLLHDPQVIVLDEATVGLDVLAAKALLDLVRDCKQEGKTVLFSTHIMGEVSMLADKVLIISEGRELFQGNLNELEALAPEKRLEDIFVQILEGALS